MKKTTNLKYNSCSKSNDRILKIMILNGELPTKINENSHSLPKGSELKVNNKIFTVDKIEFLIEEGELYKTIILYYECDKEDCERCNVEENDDWLPF